MAENLVLTAEARNDLDEASQILTAIELTATVGTGNGNDGLGGKGCRSIALLADIANDRLLRLLRASSDMPGARRRPVEDPPVASLEPKGLIDILDDLDRVKSLAGALWMATGGLGDHDRRPMAELAAHVEDGLTELSRRLGAAIATTRGI